MFNRTAQQATAASLATVATLAILIGLNGLAVQPHADAVLARAATPADTQVIVIVGQRLPRG
jgi:hypothetical protein